MNKNEKIILIFLLLAVLIGFFLMIQLRPISVPDSLPLDSLEPEIKQSQEQEMINYETEITVPSTQSVGFIFEENSYIPEPIGPLQVLCEGFRCYDSQEFLDLYDAFEKERSDVFFSETFVYGNNDIDRYLQQKALERGYQQRSVVDESQLVNFESVRIRPEVRDAYIALRNELLTQNIRLHLVSAYRSFKDQRSIFVGKMNLKNPQDILTGIYDEKIDKVLTLSALPGFSKHHSGFAVDFGCGNDYLVYSFAETECYEWMSDNNFENIKKHGFIPSYPDGVEKQGPNPEPWEYVWVGVDENNRLGI